MNFYSAHESGSNPAQVFGMECLEVSQKNVESKIYLVRDRKVMFDSDLAELYGVETKALNRAVQRNIARFPGDFMFQLSLEEVESLRCQIGTSKEGRGGRRYLPYVFTQEGISMLSGVLQSGRAIQVNIAIMRAFVKLRAIVTEDRSLSRKLAELEKKYDGQFNSVFAAIREIMSSHAVPRKRILGLTKPAK